MGLFVRLRLYVTVRLTLSPLIITIVILIHFIRRPNHCYLERNVCLNIMISKYFWSQNKQNEYFHSLGVVGRGSETQLQVSENLHFKM